MVKKISEAEFEAAVKEGFSVVDFSATWCGPCQMLAPVLEKVSEGLEGKVKFFAVDVDEAPALCQKFGVMSVPAVFMLKDGEELSHSIGFKPQEAIEAWISDSMQR